MPQPIFQNSAQIFRALALAAALLALCGISALACTSQPAPRTATPLADARQLEARGQTAEAIRILEQSLATTERPLATHRYLGYLLLNEGRWQASAGHSEAALRLTPKDVPAQINLGYALSRLGSRSRAYFHYQQALSLDPQNVRALLYSGQLLEQMGRLEDAERRLRAAVRSTPALPEAQYELAALLVRHRLASGSLIADSKAMLNPAAYRDIVQLLQAVLAQNAEFTPALQLLAYAHLHAGNSADAIRFGERALAAVAGSHPVDAVSAAAIEFNLGLAYLNRESYPEARRHFEAVIDRYSETARAHCLLGDALGGEGDWDRALAAYGECERLRPGTAMPRLRQACAAGVRRACAHSSEDPQPQTKP